METESRGTRNYSFSRITNLELGSSKTSRTKNRSIIYDNPITITRGSRRATDVCLGEQPKTSGVRQNNVLDRTSGISTWRRCRPCCRHVTQMTKLKRESFRFLIASVIICAAFAVAPIGPTGCSSFNPPTQTQASTDQVILRAEQTAQTARLTFDTFVRLERDNEDLLKQANSQIHVYANTIRAHGLDWVDSLRTATKTFKANRTAENQATLNTWITTLTNAITQTNKYITQAKKVSQP
jgi:hypothetical protein